MQAKLRDPASERALLGTIVNNGKGAFIDADGIVSANDFSLPINKAMYTCLKNMSEDSNCLSFDLETIKMKAKVLGLDDYFKGKKELEYIENLDSFIIDKENIPLFAYQIKKYSVVRDMHKRYTSAVQYLENISGDEHLSDIIRKAEGDIIDFITGVDNGDNLELLSENIEQYIEQLIESEPVDQVGLTTGFPIWDDAIGGGLRRSTVNVIAARPKKGKSFLALNKGLNVAKKNIPVLYLDSELTSQIQRDRLIAINSGCPLRLLETSQFKKQEDLLMAVRESGKSLKNLPFTYKSIAGMSHTEALAYARRWLVNKVGFNDLGEANDCLIIYDYMKLTSGSGLTKVTPEYILLGLMLTDMHNFAVKYSVPFLGFVQVNREGIDNTDSSIISQSDRILWLCSSMSVLRDKEETDIELGSSWEHGNKKLIIMETRFGAGLMHENDFINLHASLRPRVRNDEATGFVKEGFKHSDVHGSFQSRPTNQPSNSEPNQRVG